VGGAGGGAGGRHSRRRPTGAVGLRPLPLLVAAELLSGLSGLRLGTAVLWPSVPGSARVCAALPRPAVLVRMQPSGGCGASWPPPNGGPTMKALSLAFAALLVSTAAHPPSPPLQAPA